MLLQPKLSQLSALKLVESKIGLWVEIEIGLAELGLIVSSRLAAVTNLQQGNVFILDTRTVVMEKVVEVERFRKTESGSIKLGAVEG